MCSTWLQSVRTATISLSPIWRLLSQCAIRSGGVDLLCEALGSQQLAWDLGNQSRATP